MRAIRAILARSVAASLVAAGLMTSGLMSGPALAQATDYPTKAIQIYTPYSAGGPYDILARFVGEALRKQNLKHPVIIEAKPGGNTLVGIQAMLQAPADGHTLLVSTQPILSNIQLMKNPGYKFEDVIPVGAVARHPYILFVPASLPVSNLAELRAYAEKNNGKLNIGALSPGGQVQLLADRFIRASKLKIEKIPYKGAADLATALLTGDIQMSFFAYSAGAPFLKDGKIKAIAIATDERSALTPEIPTFKELGMPEVTGESWVALFARANTPKPVVDKIRAMMTEVMKDPDYVAKIKGAGNEPWIIDQDKVADYIRKDNEFWSPDLKLIDPQ